MRTETVETINGRNVRGTTAAEWSVYQTASAAKRNSANGAYNPIVAEWSGGFITAPQGHPIPDGARIISRYAFGKWRDV